MIKSITVTNYLGDSVKIDLARPEESGFAITSISGLGPGKANINTTDIATNDGALYNSARLPYRNIVISMRYLWAKTIEETRQRSYKYFPIKKKVTLTIETDYRLASITGYVESNEPEIFSKTESTKISIICPDPFFYSAGDEIITQFSGITPLFEFPFENNSTTEDLIEVGQINFKTVNYVYYEGDSEVGVVIHVHALGDVKNLTIRNATLGGEMRIDSAKLEAMTGSGIIDGDDITITTLTGQKSVVLLREGVEYNILNCIDKNPTWFKLAKGDNIFGYETDEGTSNLQFEIRHRMIYEGV